MLYIKSKIELVFLIFFLVNCNLFSQEKIKMDNSIYKFKVQDISGNIFDFSTLKGKKIMIVNTASNCGLTNQYEKLESLYEKHSSNNFVIVGFPANNFLNIGGLLATFTDWLTSLQAPIHLPISPYIDSTSLPA